MIKNAEILAEQTIYAFNAASVKIMKMIRCGVLDFAECDRLVKTAKNKKKAFHRIYFGKTSKESIENIEQAGELVPEINTAMETFNRVLSDLNGCRKTEVKNVGS